MSKKSFMTVIGIISSLILLACIVAVVAGAWLFSAFNSSALSFEGQETVSAATYTPVPVIDRTPVTDAPTSRAAKTPPQDPLRDQPVSIEGGQASPLQVSTEQLLVQTVLPQRDQRLLAMRLKHKGQDIPKVVPRDSAFQVGDIDTFWITDNQQEPPRQFQLTATLRYVTDHSYWWVADGFRVDEEALQRSAIRFEEQTYPTNRAFFGSEWSPGVDGDPRVHVFMGDVPGVAGYFSASNEYSHLAEPYSNEREMFFINLNAISPGNDYFDSVLAHEFQHMIHWYQDRNEDTWVNEGFSELATFINGYGVSSFIGAFAAVPDTQLTSWADIPGEAIAHYGGSFLFMTYFLQRYGEEISQAVVANAANGVAGFDAVLAENGYAERFDDVFGDFLVANYLNDLDAGDGKWGYVDLSLGPISLAENYSVYPVENAATVYQYGADYIALTGQGDVTVDFTGSTRVKVVDNEAHSGKYQWYSHRGDDINTRLTRTFDLTGVEAATLNYWTWYDIETDWDYGYVEVSTDGGQTWTILSTPHSATSNPSGNAYGPGYTGPSGGEEPIWIQESVDISAYTGQEIMVRFEYVTDDAVNRSGWTIDDISIPEIGYSDDFEQGASGWQAEGFVLIDNILPQRFLVQVLEIGDAVNLSSVPLDGANSGTATITGLGSDIEQAILIVSGTTPVTTQPASYQYKLLP